MFNYFGSKYYLAKHYPEPKYDLIIEPFAGSAQYAYHYSGKQVILIEKDVRVYNIWKWLQRVKKEDVLTIPHPAPGAPINYHIAEARDLLALGVKRGQMFGNFAGTKDWTDSWPAKRQKIADGLERIRHWDIRLGEYYQIANYEATWFIDPPLSRNQWI